MSDLRGAAGAIRSSAIEVAQVRYGRVPGYPYGGPKVTDWWLARTGVAEVSLSARKTTRLWLTVRVPVDARAGTYRGDFSLRSQAGRETRLPILLEVVPIRLAPVPGVQFCLLSTVAFGQYHDAKSRVQRRADAVRFYRELKDHGMTCVSPKCSDYSYKKGFKTGCGYTPGHLEGLEVCVEVAKEVGLDGPVLWNMAALVNAAKGGKNFADYDGKCDFWNESRDLANLRKIVREVKVREKAREWPEVVFYTIDEPGTMTDNLPMRRLRLGSILPKTLRVVHELGARGTTTMSEPVDEKHNRRWVKKPDELRRLWDLSRPYCHVRIYAYGYPQGRTNLEFEKADCRRRGHEMWFYNNGASMGTNRWCARMYFGLWGWRVGAEGITSWTYPGGRTVQMEMIREGIDDWKYLAAIERLVREREGSAADRAAAAEFLRGLRESIKLDANGFIGDWQNVAAAGIGKVTTQKLGTDWKAVEYDALRRAAAELIKKLVR